MLQALPIILRTAVATAITKAIVNVYNNRDMGDLSGTNWAVITKHKSDIEQVLKFKDNEISGFGGCNNFFGQYTQNGRRLTVGTLASTRKAGPHLVAETALLSALQAARRFTGTPSEIKIYGESDDILLTLKHHIRTSCKLAAAALRRSHN